MEPKPTYEEQLDWLETIKLLNPEMIKAIKENVIAVRNYEKALEKELEQPETNCHKSINNLNLWLKP